MENYSTLSRDRTFRKRSYSLVIFAIVALLGLYGIIFMVQNHFAGTRPDGEQGSSYATIATGNRAWSELLSANSFSVTRDRGRATLPSLSGVEKYGSIFSDLTLYRKTQTVVLLGGALPSSEVDDLREFIRSGGRLITDNPLVLDDTLGKKVSVSLEGARDLASNTDMPGMEGVENVEGSGVGSVTYDEGNSAQPLLSSDENFPSDIENDNHNDFAHAAIFRLGSGDVIALIDSGVVTNNALPRKDNALFSLRIVGSENSEVTFIEGVHGFNDARGFAGMPLSWRIAIIGLFAAFVVFGCAQGRRFGVGEEPNRDLGPRRIYFAHAIAQALKKSKG